MDPNDESPAPLVPLMNRLKSANRVTEEWRALETYRNIAAAIALGVLVTANVAGSDIMTILNKMDIFVIGRMVVGLWLTVLALLWIFNGNAELAYLQKWVRTGHYQSRRPFVVMVTFIILAVIFALLIVLSKSVRAFLLLNCLYLLFDVFTWKVRRDEIGSSLDQAETFLARERASRLAAALPKQQRELDLTVADIYQRAAGILRSYYFANRHIGRILLTIAPMALMLVVASWCHFRYFTGDYSSSAHGTELLGGLVLIDPPGWTVTIFGGGMSIDWIRSGVYTAYVLTMLISELVLHAWRNRMRHGLLELDAELFDLGVT